MTPLRRQLQDTRRLRAFARWGGLVAAGGAAGACAFFMIEALAASFGGPTPMAAPPASAQAGAPRRFFNTCTDARAAGFNSIRRGEPGYAPHLDADNDGVACEPIAPR